jgi:hypothetical protein
MFDQQALKFDKLHASPTAQQQYQRPTLHI